MSKIGSLIKKAAKKKTPKKKDAHPEIEAPELKKEINDWLAAKKKEKEAKAELSKIGSKLIEKAEQERTRHIRANKRYTSTVKIDDGEGNTVTVSSADRYSAIDTDDEDELREIYEGEFDTYFDEVTEISLKPEAINDEELLEKLIEAVGEDGFGQYFDVKQQIQPKKGRYHEDRVMDPDLAEKHERAVAEGLVSPAKPSVKAGK